MSIAGYSSRFKLILSLLAASGLSTVMVAARIAATGQWVYTWLIIPNLLLAWAPLIVSEWMQVRYANKRKADWLMMAAGVVWVLFYPNAPYMITDLVHLTYLSTPDTVHMDLLINVSAVMTGLLLGYMSLLQVHGIVRSIYGTFAGMALAVAVQLLSAVGIYLGRFLRWNSWDMALHPGRIAADLFSLPQNPDAMLFIAGYALMLGTIYAVLVHIGKAMPADRN